MAVRFLLLEKNPSSSIFAGTPDVREVSKYLSHANEYDPAVHKTIRLTKFRIRLSSLKDI